MPTKSEDKTEGRIVRRHASEIVKTSPEELARMAAVRDEDLDFSDIPEGAGMGPRLKRDQDGQLPRRRSVIRETIVETLKAREMTAYSLCKAAKEHSPTITEAAIGEFLKGQRSIGLEYLEAIMAVLGLVIGQPGGLEVGGLRDPGQAEVVMGQ